MPPPRTTPTAFHYGDAPINRADFDLGYEGLTPGSVRGTASAWTVRDGDTLQSIATAAWGDASLWYLIAEANGLNSTSQLVAGQSLSIPAKVANVHNTSDTFRPYDPNKAMGDVSPTQPKPVANPGKKGCGVVGQIIAVVIAVVVAAYVGPALLSAMAGQAGATAGAQAALAALANGATAAAAQAAGWAATVASVSTPAAFAAGALTGAAASMASQAFLIATGAQDTLNWKQVGMSALSAGITRGVGGMATVDKFVSKVPGPAWVQEGVRGAGLNVLTQGVSVAVGLQDRFDWSGVAVAGVISGVATRVGSSGLVQQIAGQSELAAQAVVGLTSGVAGAATLSLINGTSFGDNLNAVLPNVIGQTVGNMVAGKIQNALVSKQTGYVTSAENGGWVDEMLAQYPGSYQIAGTLVAGGQPTAQRGFWKKVGDFFKDPVGTTMRAGRALMGAVADTIDYTRRSIGATYAAGSADAVELSEVVVTGVRDAPRAVGKAWTDFTYAWRTEPHRQRGGDTFFNAPPPSNPVAWLKGDIGFYRAKANDTYAHADGLKAMRSLMNSRTTNAGLSTRAFLENVSGAWGETFSVPAGVIDTVLGRPADAIGLRWNSPDNVTGHQMFEPAIGIGAMFVGNPEVLAAGMTPKVIGIGRSEMGAAELLATERAAVRSRVLVNIAESQAARESSNASILFAKEAQMGAPYGGIDALIFPRKSGRG